MLEQPTQQLSISCRDEESGIRMLGRVGDQRLQFLGRFADRVAAKSDPARITDNLAVPFDNCGDLLGDCRIQLERARKAVGFATDLLTPWEIVRSREPYPIAVCCVHRDRVLDRQEGLANIESGFRIECERSQVHRRLYEPHLGETDLMRPSKCGLQQLPTDTALRSGIDSERSNGGYRAFGYDREENAANDPPVPLDQKSLRVRVIHLATNKSKRNCERGKLRWKIVRSGNGGVCAKGHRRTGLCVLGAHVSKLGIGITHLNASYSELSN